MNRTVVILASAAALVLLALLKTPQPKPVTPAATAMAKPAAEEPAPVSPPPPPAPPLETATASDGSLRLEARLASRYAANSGSPNYLAVNVLAQELPKQARSRKPVNLAVVIDRSGSMEGEKLEAARAAARQLISQLRDDDRLALVRYGSDVRVMSSMLATAEHRRQMLGFVDDLMAEGGTNISEGLRAGEREVTRYASDYRTTRVILLTDGHATEGETSADGLLALARGMRERGVTLTALGIGSDFDEVLMRGLAENGGGFYGYLEDLERLPEVFSRELEQASQLVARQVFLELEPGSNVRVDEVLGHSMLNADGRPAVRLYDFSAGLTERVVVRLSVDRPEGTKPEDLLRVRLVYRDLVHDTQVASEVPIIGTITSDAKLALEQADQVMLEHAARAERAKQMQLAAAQFREGRTEEARHTLEFGLLGMRSLFGSSADALAGDTQSIDGMDANTAAKSLESKSMKSFGANNSY